MAVIGTGDSIVAAPSVQAMDLRPADVVHIGPHRAHGIPVGCADANVEVTGVHFAGENHREVVVDYVPWVEWPGDRPSQRGSVVYDRTTLLHLLWHGTLAGLAGGAA